MQLLSTKITGNTLLAVEWNEVPKEIENIITVAGQALSGASLNQLGIGVSEYSAVSTFYSCTGPANAYVATKTGSFQAPQALTTGMIVRFRPSADNTGPSTVNVNTLGVIDILSEAGVALVGGELSITRDAFMRYDGTQFLLFNFAATSQLESVRGGITGLQMSNEAGDADHDILVSVGDCRDALNTNTIDIPVTLIKQIDAIWAAGTNQGGRPAAVSLTVDTWYHVFAIRKNNGLTDIGFDTSITAVALLSASGYDQFRRIGSVLTDGSSNIISFIQQGNNFQWSPLLPDFDDTNPGTSQQSRVMNTPLGVITKVIASLKTEDTAVTSGTTAYFSAGPGDSVLATPTSALSISKQREGATGDDSPTDSSVVVGLLTNLLSEIEYRLSASSATLHVIGATVGWVDDRGKNV